MEYQIHNSNIKLMSHRTTYEIKDHHTTSLFNSVTKNETEKNKYITESAVYYYN